MSELECVLRHFANASHIQYGWNALKDRALEIIYTIIIIIIKYDECYCGP